MIDAADTIEKAVPPDSSSRQESADFESLLSDLSLSPIPNNGDTFVTYKQNLPLPAQQQFVERINPFHLYQTDTSIFHSIWLNSDVTDPDQFGGNYIGWQETLQSVGNREAVNQVLHVLASCFKGSGDVYEWKKRTTGFHVENHAADGAMCQPGYLGVPVSYRYCAIPLINAIRVKDREELRRQYGMLTSQFIHERAHREFDQMGPGRHPEAVSQACQFLYDPGNNELFEKDMYVPSIVRANAIFRRTAKTNSFNVYELGNIEWSTYLWQELTKRYPDIFSPLTDSTEDTINKLLQLPLAFKSLRQEIGKSQWPQLQQKLMRMILEFDPDDQSAIIQEFQQKAQQYGLGFVLKPDPNYKQATIQ